MKYIILATACFAAAPVCAQSASMAEVEGLWSAHLDFGPETEGDLTIKRQGDDWTATIAGQTVAATELSFTFEDGDTFDGAITADGAIEGWWTQPPGFWGQAYATPLRLSADGKTWRGAATPLAQTFDLYLKIFENDDGAWRAAFRNPQYNLNGWASQFAATRAGEQISFSARDGAVSQEATYDEKENTLTLSWSPAPAPVVMTHAAPGDAAAFSARETQEYRYARPQQTDDGWETARARKAGIDEDKLASLIESIIAADPASARPLLIHSLLVARDGKLVLEEYFYGHDRKTPHDIRSGGKTFASVLLGGLMHEGLDIGPQTRLVDLLDTDDPGPRKSEITLAHLLTHTSGLDCNDNEEDSPGNEGNLQSQTEEPDWVRYALNLSMVHTPGERYAYCSAGINLAGGAIAAAAGESVPDLFDHLIAKPLQFGRYHWNLAPDGAGYLGGGAYILPRDLLKLGQAYLNGGVWNGRRIVSADWVAQSTAAHVDINEETTGMDAETFANNAIRGADGLAWHRYPIHIGERTIEAYEANGNGGQYLVVVPDYDLTVVMTGGNYRQGAIWLRWRDEIIGEQIIGAIKD